MRWITLASSALTGLLVAGWMALAAPPGVINQFNALCDANFPTRCASVAADGTLKTTAGGSGGGGAAMTATAADPTYVEGSTTNPLSSDLTGYLRVKAKAPAAAFADGWDVTQGAKTDARSTATDATAITVMQVMKEISFMEQTPANRGVTQVTSPWVVTGPGSAGAAAAGVVTVQGITSMTPLLTTPTGGVTAADGAALTATLKGYALGGVYNGATIDMAREAANSLNSTGAGLPAAQLVGQCDDTSQTALTENQFGNARVDCASHAQLVSIVPSATAGGASLFTLTLANTTNATNVKATPGQVYSISGFNMSSATPVWISLYNNAGTPTCGTAVIQQFMIPGSTTGAGFVYDFAVPKAFAAGIAFCATTGIAGTGSPAASTYVLNIDYR